ncbi:MAG: hypothetical protein F2534_07015 [Actinobacteria bacterium]|uniref:Unannotated protein n=1 Tax=freshwater metagenome TaxID=449393 RepID=A0A6J6CV75_9ZZZZ|nr:hypothetical protein [Actinomycetota bacterium]
MGNTAPDDGLLALQAAVTRRRFLQRLAMTSAFGAASAALLANCSSDGDEGAPSTGAASTDGAGAATTSVEGSGTLEGFRVVGFSGGGTGKPLAELRIATQAPGAIVPGFAFDPGETVVRRLAWNSLVALDNEGNPVLADAESYTPNADLTEHVFTLRDGLQWSDGTPYDAQTYIDSLLYRLPLGGIFGPSWLVGMNDVLFNGADPSTLGYEAPDPKTLIFRSTAPVPFIERFLASNGDFFPIPMHLFADADSSEVLASMSDPANFVCNGPYVITENSPGSIVYERNPRFSSGGPAGVADRVVTTVFDAMRSSQSFNAFRSGELDVVTVGANDIPSVQADADLSARTTQIVWPNYNMVVVNHNREPLGDPRVRTALHLAIDRKVLAESVLSGSALPMEGLLSPGYEGYDPDFRAVDVADPAAEAQRLLAEAGFPGGEGFPELTYITQGDASFDLISQTLIGMWNDVLGITVKLQRLDPASWFSAVITPEDVAEWGDLADAPWPAAFRDPADTFPDLLYFGGVVYHHNWTMPDDLLARCEAALYEVDPVVRASALAEVNAAIMKELPIIPVTLLNDIQVRREGIAGQFAAYGSEFYGLRHVSAE